MTIKAYSKAKDGNKKLSTNFKVKEFACTDGSDPIFIDSDLIFNNSSSLDFKS